jgi:nucleoside phosphorylase
MTHLKIRPLSEFKGHVDIGLITFRDDEFEAVLERFPPKWLIVDGERQYNVSEFMNRPGRHFYMAIVRTIEQGHRDAQSTTQALIADLDPSWLVLVGIAGAKPESEFSLGDVVVGTRVHDFSVTAELPNGRAETAMSSDAAHPIVATAFANLRATKSLLGPWDSEAAIGRRFPPIRLDNSDFLGSDEEWKLKIRDSLLRRFPQLGSFHPPRVTAAAIGSGNTLMKSPSLLQTWLEFARDLKAVEMEAPGVFAAATSTRGNKPVMAIRGISDIVGYKRDPAWTEYACHTAASFCHALLKSGVLNMGAKQKPTPSTVELTESELEFGGGGLPSANVPAIGDLMDPQALSLTPDVEASLADHLNYRSDSRPSLVLRGQSGQVLGVFVTREEYELLNAAAELARDPNRLQRLDSRPSGDTMSFEAVFDGKGTP